MQSRVAPLSMEWEAFVWTSRTYLEVWIAHPCEHPPAIIPLPLIFELLPAQWSGGWMSYRN